jgi:transcription antitermination factor NusG
MNTAIPFVGNIYEIISGQFEGFIGKCVSYDLEHDLPVILQDEKYNGAAARVDEIKLIGGKEKNISRTQQN